MLNLGDLIDREFKNLPVVLADLDRLPCSVHHVLGNHDFDVDDEHKPEVPGMFELERAYYSVALDGGWRLVVLDGNEVSLFAHAPGSREFHFAESYRCSLPGPPEPWNGALDAGQMRWLAGELDGARARGERVLLCCHYPLLPADSRFILWNAGELRALMASHQDVIAAYFCGHHHEGFHDHIGRIPHINFVGMVDTLENAYSIVRIDENSIRVRGFGRQPDLEFSPDARPGGGGGDHGDSAK